MQVQEVQNQPNTKQVAVGHWLGDVHSPTLQRRLSQFHSRRRRSAQPDGLSFQNAKIQIQIQIQICIQILLKYRKRAQQDILIFKKLKTVIQIQAQLNYVPNTAKDGSLQTVRQSVIVFSYSQIYRIEFGSQEGLNGQFWIITKPARNGNEN